MAILISTLLALGRLSSDLEVLALKSSGVHPFQIIGPALVFSLILTLGLVYFNHQILPESNFAFKKRYFKIVENQINVALKEKEIINTFSGYQFYISQINDQGILRNVEVFLKSDSKSPLQVTLAKSGKLITDKKNLQVSLDLKNGVSTWTSDKFFQIYNRVYFKNYIINLTLENQFKNMSAIKKGPKEMNFFELWHKIQHTQHAQEKNRLEIEFQKRLSLPFACLAVTWFCAPMAIWLRKKGFLSFILGIFFIFIYYILFMISELMCERNLLSPAIGLWIPNICFLVLGSVLYYFTVKEREILTFLSYKKKTSI